MCCEPSCIIWIFSKFLTHQCFSNLKESLLKLSKIGKLGQFQLVWVILRNFFPRNGNSFCRDKLIPLLLIPLDKFTKFANKNVQLWRKFGFLTGFYQSVILFFLENKTTFRKAYCVIRYFVWSLITFYFTKVYPKLHKKCQVRCFEIFEANLMEYLTEAVSLHCFSTWKTANSFYEKRTA